MPSGSGPVWVAREGSISVPIYRVRAREVWSHVVTWSDGGRKRRCFRELDEAKGFARSVAKSLAKLGTSSLLLTGQDLLAFAGLRTADHVDVRASQAKTRSRRLAPALPALTAWVEPRRGEGLVCPLESPWDALRKISRDSGVAWKHTDHDFRALPGGGDRGAGAGMVRGFTSGNWRLISIQKNDCCS